jgi:CubicO group peptidase (beta-lactamase class C family)
MNKRLLFLMIVLLTTRHTFAQVITEAQKPEMAGFSAERLKRLDANMNDWVSKGWMNGAVGLIVRNGKIVYYKSAGVNDINTKSPMQKDGIFRIASQTKAITSVAVIMLYEEGKFLLDDAVSKYIPAFANQKVLDKFNEADTTYTTVPVKSPITIRDLLTHTSGLGYAQIGTKEADAIYAKNNITASLDVSADNLANAMKRLGRILEPLGMKDTYFNVPAEKRTGLFIYITKIPLVI